MKQFFEKILLELDSEFLKKNQLILSYSGGADSSLLLEFLKYLYQEKKILKPILFHLNHKLRNNQTEILGIKKILEDSGFHFIYKEKNIFKLSKKIKKSLEETGRIFRYHELKKIQKKSNGIILTAHQLDDYLETSLIHLIRGAGESAFKNLPIYENGILRPFVKIPKDKILELLNENQIPYFEDESNTSEEYLRNRIRKKIIPILKEEKLNIKKLYENFHEKPIFESFEKSVPSFLKLNLDNFDFKDLKTVLDIYLKNLGLHPIKKNLFLKIKNLLEKEEAIHLENSEVFFWKSKTSELFLIPKNSPLLKEVEHDGENFIWNKNPIPLAENEILGFYEKGLKIKIRNQTKEISEILRENQIPRILREKIPIIKKDGKVISILVDLFDKKLKRVNGDL